MTVREKVAFFVQNGVKINFLAKRVGCHPGTIKNLIEGAFVSEAMQALIKQGLENYYNEIKKIMED